MDSNPDSTTRADVLLEEALVMFAPLARLLVANGVAYPQFAQALKRVFLTAARAELAAASQKSTDSAVSLLSGVHRKDVRTLADAEHAASRSRSLSAEVFTRWIHDDAWRTAEGTPSVLPRTGPAPSFEALALSVSKDFHPRAILDELVRLGLAEVQDDDVALKATAFVPQHDFRELAYLYGANLRDHLAAGAANLTAASKGQAPAFLEQSVFADDLSEASIEALAGLARSLWADAFDAMVGAATDRFNADQPAGGDRRMRFGIYFYAEPTDSATAQPAGSRT
ncbi:DUF6502 family protein [soil metagenome]